MFFIIFKDSGNELIEPERSGLIVDSVSSGWMTSFITGFLAIVPTVAEPITILV